MISPFICIEFNGDKAFDVINGQSTQVAPAPKEKNAPLAAFCDPKGRMFGSGRLLVIDRVLHFITPLDQVDFLLQQLSPFLSLSRVSSKISDRPVVLTQRANSNPGQVSGDDKIIVVGEYGGTAWIIGDSSASHQIEADVLRLKSGLGFVRSSSTKLCIPQQAHYQMLGGISFNKGCYTGQEIIARLEHLGQTKKYLWVFEGQAIPSGGTLELENSLRQPVFDYVKTLNGSAALVLAPADVNSEQLTRVPFAITRQVEGQRPIKL